MPFASPCAWSCQLAGSTAPSQPSRSPPPWRSPPTPPPRARRSPLTKSWSGDRWSAPYVDHAAWRAELDEMQRQYERREALRAVAEGQPDPGYTYPGAQHLAGAVA
ncbi:hypothetical protein ACFV0O_01960 [Kitasatospora sp. NPDC059577]|uniref:hypothetical protein n=1 Tax=Kitasatospora sp. NPDC059577 TaxID=3346873 RepID=UPI0036B6613D